MIRMDIGFVVFSALKLHRLCSKSPVLAYCQDFDTFKNRAPGGNGRPFQGV
jgi:hypothetical protein